MTARSFADTNVVVYTLDADPNKRRAAITVMRAHPVISVQVINEFLSVATGKMKLHHSHGPRGNASVDAPRPVAAGAAQTAFPRWSMGTITK